MTTALPPIVRRLHEATCFTCGEHTSNGSRLRGGDVLVVDLCTRCSALVGRAVGMTKGNVRRCP